MLLSSIIASTLLLSAPPSCTSSCTMSETLAGAVSSKAGDIVDVAGSAGDFSTLLAAAKAGGLVETLRSAGPFTVFAPTDAAFAKLPAGTVEMLLKPENKEALVGILTYHVVPGRLESGKVLKTKTLDTVNGQRAGISMKNGKPMIDGATIIATDVEASNGIIHVVDAVILPESKNVLEIAKGGTSFYTLAAAIEAADLASVLEGKGPFTVLAPTDEAFAKLPAGTLETLLKPENKDQLRNILLYHVIPGRVYADQVVKLKKAPTAAGVAAPITVTMSKDKKTGPVVRVGGGKVVKTDIDASNGVIHVIDTVILPQ